MFRTLRYLRTQQAYRSVGASSLPCCSIMQTQGAAHGSGGAPPDFPQKHARKGWEGAPATRGGAMGDQRGVPVAASTQERKSPRNSCRLSPIANRTASVLVCIVGSRGSRARLRRAVVKRRAGLPPPSAPNPPPARRRTLTCMQKTVPRCIPTGDRCRL